MEGCRRAWPFPNRHACSMWIKVHLGTGQKMGSAGGETGWHSLTPHPAPDLSEPLDTQGVWSPPRNLGHAVPGERWSWAACGPCWLSCGAGHTCTWRDTLLTPVILSHQVLGLRDVLHQAHPPARRHHGHRQLLHLPYEQEKGKGRARTHSHAT